MPSKYLNNDQRQDVFWIISVADWLEENRGNWSQANRKIIDDLRQNIEDASVELMDGINEKELKSIMTMAGRIKPVLVASDYTVTDDKITVDADTFYKVSEYAVEHCRYQAITRHIMGMTNAKEIKRYLKENMKNCNECSSPDNCKLREELLTLMVPPFVTSGPCEWYREEGVTDGKA